MDNKVKHNPQPSFTHILTATTNARYLNPQCVMVRKQNDTVMGWKPTPQLPVSMAEE